MNNQQEPFNSPFSPKTGNQSGDAGQTENTRPTGTNGRLGRKANLRNLADQRTEPPMTNPDWAPQQPTTGNGPQSFQNFQSPPSQSASNFNPMGNSNAQLGANSQPQRTPTGQPGGNSGMYSNQTGALSKTGALMHPAGEYSGDTGMLKLNQAVKVVRIPVAGKPGEFKTGILPVISQTPTGALPPPPVDTSFQGKVKKNGKLVLLAALALLIVFGSGIYMMTRSNGNMVVTNPGSGNKPGLPKASLNATATVRAQPTPTFIIDDNLSSNGHSWLLTEVRPDLLSDGMKMYFADNAYHVSSKKTKDVPYFASSVQRGIITPKRYTLSVDMQQIKGDEGNAFNFFGLLFNYTEIGGHPITYAFRLINNKDDRRYEFSTLDGRQDGSGWSDPKWQHATGKEFKGGKAKNNLKVQVVNHQFTFFVNGVKLGSATDSSYGPGYVGVGVNGLSDKDGSDVAFTNFVMTTTN